MAWALSFTRTAGRWPPARVTRPTPETWEIFCATRVSTMSSTWVIGIAEEVTARVMIGGSAGFTLLYTGGLGRSLGSRLVAALMAACTSCSATSSGRVSWNCSVTTEAPPELCDDICLRPDIWPNWRSSGAVMAEVTTSGLAPG